ncbi:DUF6713 family protein [Hymenobacter sp. IS2118]|uniref:DUF6713 family protein n=1 Tax=Hymenobacter sp. IS2118 TaxID=1505605 RepID=UPI00055549D5|nr:DUF6713 family protein [Hymenobacter sp. IS2118]
MNHLLFFLGLSTILVHEMDAVRLAEWRILLGFLKLSDSVGYVVFTAVHIPLYVAMFWFLFNKPTLPGTLNMPLVRALEVFFILHAGLHWFFRHHKHYHFTSAFSKILIGLPALCGALDLALTK